MVRLHSGQTPVPQQKVTIPVPISFGNDKVEVRADTFLAFRGDGSTRVDVATVPQLNVPLSEHATLSLRGPVLQGGGNTPLRQDGSFGFRIGARF
eukprot:tig00001493_g8980.t1